MFILATLLAHLLCKQALSLLLRDRVGVLQSLGETNENHGKDKYMKEVKPRSLSPSPEVIREGFLEEWVPNLGPKVGIVPGQRTSGLWD